MINTKLRTIGYGNRSIEEFVSLLSQNKIEILVDVRSRPVSRYKPEYNKNALSLTLAEHGITYVHKGKELGGLLAEGTTYDELRETQSYQAGLSYLIEEIVAGRQVVIMCCELDPLTCHRYLLIGEDLSQQDVEVLHIGKDGKLINHMKRLM